MKSSEQVSVVELKLHSDAPVHQAVKLAKVPRRSVQSGLGSGSGVGPIEAVATGVGVTPGVDAADRVTDGVAALDGAEDGEPCGVLAAVAWELTDGTGEVDGAEDGVASELGVLLGVTAGVLGADAVPDGVGKEDGVGGAVTLGVTAADTDLSAEAEACVVADGPAVLSALVDGSAVLDGVPAAVTDGSEVEVGVGVPEWVGVTVGVAV